MDWSLLIFLVVVTFFAYRGYKKGLLRSISRVLSLLAGYIAAILFSADVSTIIEQLTPAQGITALIVASGLLFLAATIAVGLVFKLIGKIFRQDNNISKASSVGGSLVGLLAGLIVAVLIVWTFAFVRTIQPQDQVTEFEKPDNSTIESITNRIASKAVDTALSLSSVNPEVASLSTALIESPGEISNQAQRLASSNDLSTLLGNPENQAILNRGDILALKELPAFQQLVHNPDMLALAKSAGMLDEATGNTEALETTLANQLIEIWTRMQRVKNDQRVQEILENPEFQRKIQSGNPVDLLTNAPLLELADIIFEDREINETDRQNDSAAPGTLENEKTIYSWTDENGRIHYSDKAPE